MSAINSAPKIIEDSAEKELALPPGEILKMVCSVEIAVPTSCKLNVAISLFFDGTNNNMERDEADLSHSNIVRLYKVHKTSDRVNTLFKLGCYAIYIPGVGTRFEANDELRETADGKAMAKGGQARILYGLLKTYNAVYKTIVGGKDWLDEDAIAEKIKAYRRDVEQQNNYDPQMRQPRPNRKSWFANLREELNKKLEEARQAKPKPMIPAIKVAVFGFSRGAIEARAFCYWLDAALDHGRICGIPVEINFLGLFDSVASVGLANSASETTILWFANGHFDWAAETLKPLPGLVKKTVHYIAAHEQRMNFPITRVLGGNASEYIYPGVHSDIGGGYGKNDQGRAGSIGKMLSQVPLLHMHKAAAMAGVPLALHQEMPSDIKEDFALDAELAKRWNLYMAADAWSGSYEELINAHMRLYYRYRRFYLNGFENSKAFQGASAQDQEDLRSYNALLLGDLKLLKEREKGGRPRPPERDRFPNNDNIDFQGNAKLANKRALSRSDHRSKPDTIENIALKVFDAPADATLPPELQLLDEHVHDSLAGFYLAGYVTKEEKADRLLEMQKKPPSTNDPYDRKVYENAQADAEVSALLKTKGELRKDRERVFSPGEQDKLKTDKVFPVLTDADAPELRNRLITSQTWTRREGGGYLKERYVFPD
ncbi:T6SS phospholipase effector Tle1-like catalytic domain-containing protein [Iodobacter arcticus]|uniref:T6SS phospholipase effector Tle1-like catalytic domain-containing protein n=1 Tax=Iodobacter arcticus TaxID=590593 RepID=A0ABW2R3X9_9NEIS